jgi:hypothetical protein
MSRLIVAAAVALLLPAMLGVQEPATGPTGNTPKGVRVFNANSVKEPGKAAAELVDIHESEHMVTRLMRLGSRIATRSLTHPLPCR